MMAVTTKMSPESAAPFDFMKLYSEVQLIAKLFGCNFQAAGSWVRKTHFNLPNYFENRAAAN